MTDALDTEPKGNARAYHSTPTSEMVVDNTLTTITKWQYVWNNSNHSNSTCDFAEFKKYATDEHIRLLISKFQQSGWRDASKVSNFYHIRHVLAYAYQAQNNNIKNKIEFNPETCVQYIHANYLSMVSSAKGVSSKPISASTLGRQGAQLSSICKRFGLGQIPKAARNLGTKSASLDSNNYSKKFLSTIAFALLSDRKILLNQYQDETLSGGQRKLAFDRLMCNAVFLTIYYLGTGQTETLNMFLDDVWVCKNTGSSRILIEGFKTRGNTIETRSFTPRATCKHFFESHIELSKTHSTFLGLDKHYLFRKTNGEIPNGRNLLNYAQDYLVKNSERIQKLIAENPDFKLNSSKRP